MSKIQRMNTIADFFFWVIDLIFPKDEIVRKLEMMSVDELLSGTENGQRLFVETVPVTTTGRNEQPLAVFKYHNEVIRQAIWEMKYRGNRKIIRLLAKAMADFIVEEISEEWEFIKKDKVIIIPMPISRKRRRFRGFNQMEMFSKELMKVLPTETFELQMNVLTKRIHTLPQTKIRSRKERLGNLRGVFEVAEPKKVRGRTIILLDDVITTGATMREAAGALKKSGTRRLFPIAIAH